MDLNDISLQDCPICGGAATMFEEGGGAFTIQGCDCGAQTAIAGGGRYELYLPGQNKPVPGVGFAAGMERLMLVQDALGIAEDTQSALPFFLVGLGAAARMANLKLAGELRNAGISVMTELEERSFKAQLRAANKCNARYTVVRGDSELEKGVVMLKDMSSGEQQELSAENLSEQLKQLITK